MNITTKFTEGMQNPGFVFIIIAIILGLITYSVLQYISKELNNIASGNDEKMDDSIKEKIGEIETTKSVVLYGTLVTAAIFFVYFFVRNTPFESHLMEWMNLIVRWMHIVFGIAWIGASFYFIFLENALNRTDHVRDELAGNLWAIHGGGFYYLEKYKVAPKTIPKDLHWFKYEAYFTWLSGIILLTIVYYLNAEAMLIDPEVMDLTKGEAVSYGIGSLVVSWFVYDFLSKSSLAQKKGLFFLIMFAFITFLAYILAHVFSARAAYIHVGAIMGTMMAANVFFTIIPAQKAMVNAAKKKEPLDATLGQKAGIRSLHNNYFTLPVLFIMISNHFPSTFGNENSWAVLSALTLASCGIKHYFNLKDAGQANYWILPVSAGLLIAIMIYTQPKTDLDKIMAADPVPFEIVDNIITKRCKVCHSANPTDDIYKVAPNGVKLDSPDEIVRMKDKILNRAITSKTMPQANKTKMTQIERDQLEIWIRQGAKLE